MRQQFYEHFGLQHPPFQVSPNPKKFVSTQVHDGALSQLLLGIESRRGLMLLTGEPGTGKTAILHCMLEVLQREGYSTAYVFHTLLSSSGVLRIILNDFGISCSSKEKGDLLSALRLWLIKRRQAQDCPVVVIDEAQALADHTLEDLRMLLNLEVSGTNLLQMVLAGQPQLETKLRRHRLKQLRQRVMSHCRIANLSFDDTVSYIRAHLTEAGARNVEMFSSDSLREVYQYSNGNPRTIHLLCEHSLLNAYAAGRQSVNGADILQVTREFDLDLSPSAPIESAPVGTRTGWCSTSHADSPSDLISHPKLDVESEVSHLDDGLLQGLGPSLPHAGAFASCASETAKRETPVRAATPSVDEDELSLSQAALLVASQKLATVDRRGKEILGSLLEAGRSVLWLSREHQLKFIIKSPQTPTLARRTLADVTRRGPETPQISGVGKRPILRNATRTLAPSPEIRSTRTSARMTGPTSKVAGDVGAVRVRLGNTKLEAFSGYWRSVSESLQRDIRQCLVKCGLGRDRRESKRAPPPR